MRRVALLIALSLLTARPVRAAEDDGEAEAFFEREVRPVLVERCLGCHGSEKLRGGLDLRSRAAILAGGDSGPAAEPGDPDSSLLVEAIRYHDAIRMPPDGKLDDRSIAAISRWVELGVPWPDDAQDPAQVGDSEAGTSPRPWWLEPVRDPEPPTVADRSWPLDPIDRFILAGLEADGLAPAPEAERRIFVRRVAFDLTGLPPTPEEVEAFVSDPSPDAHQRLVDRLLASPAYGQRWGRHWLDLVRYADSRDARGIGDASDIAEAWRYRDWVVAALNRDLPYDRFVVDQIAGDLVAGSGPEGFNPDGMVATGMLCIGEWGTGDSDKEKMMTDIVDDQVDVIGRVFLGLTISCARCHDHKFDPIRQRDYYALAGIFFSSHILPDPGPKTAGSPLLRTALAAPSVLRMIEQDEARSKDLQGRFAERKAAAEARFLAEQVERSGDYLQAASEFARRLSESDPPGPESLARSHGLDPGALEGWFALLGLEVDGLPLATPFENVLGAAGVHARKGSGDTPSATINTTDATVNLLTFRLPPRSVSLHPGPVNAVAVAWTAPSGGSFRVRGSAEDADSACGDGFVWEVQRHRGAATIRLAGGAVPNGERAVLDEVGEVALRPGDLIRLVIAPNDSHACDTTAVSMQIDSMDSDHSWDLAADTLNDPARFLRSPSQDVWRFLEIPTPGAGRPGELAASLEVWDRALSASDPGALATAVEGLTGEIGRADSPLRVFVTSPTSPFLARQGGRLDHLNESDQFELAGIQAELHRLRDKPRPLIPTVLAAREGGVPNSPHEGFQDARIHIRGSYLRLGEVVPRGVPAVFDRPVLEPIDAGAESGRRSLARWIADPEHPLTARVMVNRVWQHHFGEGLVRTPGNFGRLGEPPSDPGLLDHLASRFIRAGWSLKELHRAILLSATYRQATQTSVEAREVDPENRLFGRFNRRRLESEILRDALLATSGRLDRSIGGPAFRDFNTPRRTLYFMSIRSDRSSFGPLFDAADATAIVDTRTESTVAPQALFLLNHPFVLDRAAELAEEVARLGVSDPQVRVEWLYQRLFGRLPTDDERTVASELLAAAPDGIRAWAAYCQVLLCSNEFVYVD